MTKNTFSVGDVALFTKSGAEVTVKSIHKNGYTVRKADGKEMFATFDGLKPLPEYDSDDVSWDDEQGYW